MTAKLSKKQNFPIFDVFGDFAKKLDWLGYGIHTSPHKKQIDVQCVLEVFPSEMGWHYSKSVKPQKSELQKIVIARTR